MDRKWKGQGGPQTQGEGLDYCGIDNLKDLDFILEDSILEGLEQKSDMA